ALVVIAPWFIYQTQRIGSAFWDVILGQQVLRRMSSGLDPTHLEPPAFYVTSIWRSFAESQSLWLVLAGLLVALVAATRRQGTGGRLVLFWAVVPLAAMSVSHSKLIHYAYPFVPPLALCAGWAAALALQWIIDRIAPAAASSLDGRPGRWALLLLAVAAIAIAGATISLGNVAWRWPVGGTFTNSSVWRPLLLGVVLLFAAMRQPRALLVAPVLLALAVVLPLPAYAKAHRDMAVIYRPLAAVNRCLRALSASGATMPTATYLVSGLPPTHAYYYYLREFGPYTERTADHDLDQELRERLTPERLSLLLFKDVDFWNWISRAGASGVRFSALMAENDYVLVLPGATADCAAEGTRVGGKGVARP
ncbi:MAG: hypothetical protein KAY59_11520, partial [Acidobacteria bacterium]|nr:hypothetical protein [Acidobacteriota bacterium]